MSRILVTGAGGMLGRAVVEASCRRGLEVTAAARGDFDITDASARQRWIEPGLAAVINCAAFTAVDDCEDNEEQATLVNGRAVEGIAERCGQLGLPLVHVSTDYVFSGDRPSGEPYREEDAVAPASAYGRSKLVGEQQALAAGATVVRASWLFGPGGANFVTTMLRLADHGGPVRVVDDQLGCPTYTPDLAEVLVRLASEGRRADGGELLQFANPPAVTWYGFATEIFDVFARSVELSPCTTEEFPRPAPRPRFSVLSTEKLEQRLGIRPRSWREALVDYRQRMESTRPSGIPSAQEDQSCA